MVISRPNSIERAIAGTGVNKVLHLYSDWAWDGPAEIVVNLCAALRSRWQVTLMHDNSDEQGDGLSGAIRDWAPEKGVPVEAPFPLPKHYDFAKMVASGFRLSSYIRKSAIRLVHAHRLADHSIAAVASWRNRVPIVRSVYYEDPPKKLREKFLFQRFADAIIVPCERTKARFCDWLPSLEGKLWVVPPGVDTDLFNPTRIDRESVRKRFEFRENDYVVGLVSRIRPSRKVKTAVEALALALKEVPRLRLFVLGAGKPRNIRQSLVEPVAQHGMTEQVVHIPYLNGENYVEALATMDAGIFLEPGSDKSGRAVREYMAMGLPVIGCEDALLPGLVADGENGLLVTAEPQNVAKAIIQLAKEPELSKRMGIRSFAKIRAGFSVADQASATSSVYRTVIGKIDPTGCYRAQIAALAGSALHLSVQALFS
jgi:glycosyltransferase involved in cell wall biosynthesis